MFTRTKHRANRLAEYLVEARRRRRAHPRQPQPGAAHGGARRLQGRRVPGAGRDRHRGARHRRGGALARRQLRRAGLARRLRPPRRPHRARRGRRATRSSSSRREEESDLRAIERAIGKPLPRVTLPELRLHEAADGEARDPGGPAARRAPRAAEPGPAAAGRGPRTGAASGKRRPRARRCAGADRAPAAHGDAGRAAVDPRVPADRRAASAAAAGAATAAAAAQQLERQPLGQRAAASRPSRALPACGALPPPPRAAARGGCAASGRRSRSSRTRHARGPSSSSRVTV